MSPVLRAAGARVANRLWWGQGLVSVRRFESALRDPQAAQWRWLSRALGRHQACEYGERYGFAAVHSAADFARRVPVVTYDDLAPYVERVRRGDTSVLTTDATTHLAPTSGSTGARKLVPFTRSLQQHFAAAVNCWWFDLVRQRPSLPGGPSYWSVSPLETPECPPAPGDVRVGFADDAEYLGGAMAWLVRQALAVPSEVRHAPAGDAFWGLTLTALLRQRELRLLSVWHPSFVDLLHEHAVRLWPQLLDVIASGQAPEWVTTLPANARRGWQAAPAPARADELRRAGAERWPAWWPRLAVVSAWGDQAALAGFTRLRTALRPWVPQVLVQAKGLLATEAVITLPYREAYPLAVTSHYFEFLDASGEVRPAHALVRGAQYEVVVTNGGGLWRYRLGDMVECTGQLAATPTLRFLGRAGRTSDLRGEKLTEVFVAQILQQLWSEADAPYAALQPYDDGERAGYQLRTTAPDADELERRGEAALLANPHYALARALGQLHPLQVVRVPDEEPAQMLAHHRGRLGDVKPDILLAATTVADARYTGRA